MNRYLVALALGVCNAIDRATFAVLEPIRKELNRELKAHRRATASRPAWSRTSSAYSSWGTVRWWIVSPWRGLLRSTSPASLPRSNTHETHLPPAPQPWQNGEQRADEDIKQGRVRRFSNPDEALRWLEGGTDPEETVG